MAAVVDMDNPTRPLPRQATFAGSAFTAVVRGVPDSVDGFAVVAARAVVANADGAEFTAELSDGGDGIRRATFKGECFERSGFVGRGFRVEADGERGGVRRAWVFAVGDFEVVAATPRTEAGDPSAAFVAKGGDVYLKSRVVDGVQHYVVQRMAYDDEMEAWGAEWVGDYVLENGEFVEA